MSLFFLLPSHGGPIYALSGETIIDSITSRTATAGVRVNSDGTIDKLVNTTYTQIDATTDWVIPNTAADGDHEVRITAVTFNEGAGFDVEAEVEDTWIALSANRTWAVVDSTDGPAGDKDVSFTIEIRIFGTTVVSGSYRLIADYDSS